MKDDPTLAPTLTLSLLRQRIENDGQLKPDAKAAVLERLGELPDTETGRALRRKAAAIMRDLRAADQIDQARSLAAVLKDYKPAKVAKPLRGERRMKGYKQPGVEDFIRDVGPLPDSLSEMTTIAFARDRAPSSEMYEMRYGELMDARSDVQTKQDRAAFIDRLKVGYAMNDLAFFLTRGAKREVKRIEAGKVKMTETRAHVQRLVHEFDDRIRISGLDAVKQAAADGRSILILAAHQGFHLLARKALSQITLPRLLVSRGGRGSNGNVFKAENDDPTAFIRFIRTFKNSPHCLEIYPDGRQGTVLDASVLGMPIQLGAGFLTLGWRAKAAAFYSEILWDGTYFNIALKPAPDPRNYEDAEPYKSDMVAGYLSQLERFHLATPENLRPPRPPLD